MDDIQGYFKEKFLSMERVQKNNMMWSKLEPVESNCLRRDKTEAVALSGRPWPNHGIR